MLTNRYTAAALVALLLTAGAAAAQTDPAPALMVPSKIIDVGTVTQGVVVDAVFDLVNEGNGPLSIKAVRPTCGCTVADFDREIAAGATGHVNAKLDTADFAGPISKSILVMSDDPQGPTVTLVIKADVRPYVEILPRPLVRFNAVAHEPLNQTFIVAGADPEKKIKVKSVTSNVPFIATAVRELDEAERVPGRSASQYEVTLSLTDAAPVGPINAVLTVNTDVKEAPAVPVKVFGVVRALIHVTPTQVQFGSIKASTRPGRNLIVVNNRTDGTDVQVTGAEVNDSAFDARVTTIEEGRRYQVTVTVKPDAEPGSRDATLTLTTDDRDFPTVTVPVRANLG
ncbi:MAG: DUF1573 domain-containing protein [Thermoanaerobaculales bacterium]|jgi:hypothetical protein|nr:DUF1573 domain-containing protein [Thermoanaerobaculales bacterium]